jgi:hypothetical protein
MANAAQEPAHETAPQLSLRILTDRPLSSYLLCDISHYRKATALRRSALAINGEFHESTHISFHLQRCSNCGGRVA